MVARGPQQGSQPSSLQEGLPISRSREVNFAHPSEREFARILDFYDVRWEYEPRSFLLDSDEDNITEMFTPDFYLVDLDLYVELTTMKQSLVTQKNRKLRHVRERYPDINIRSLYKRDYHRLLARYGYGPLNEGELGSLGRVLITADTLERRVTELGRQISRDYVDTQPVLVGVLKGVLCFMSDLIRQISLPLSVEFMSISYLGEGGEEVRIIKDLDRSIAGRHVLMVEDIVDTGMTLNYLLNYLKTRGPASLKVCALCATSSSPCSYGTRSAYRPTPL